MVDLVLVYPYFNDNHSIFKFPPLGIGYIASYVRQHGFSVEIIDCTFRTEEEAINIAKSLKPRLLGIYSMLGMKKSALRLARILRGCCDLMIAGGPLPTSNPESFLEDFDAIVVGEGEQTVLELLESSEDLSKVDGLFYRINGQTNKTPPRRLILNLDQLPFPAREMYDHKSYQDYFRRYHGYTISSMITSRGCPFDCDFCSRPVFGRTYRSRSPPNIVDEVECVLSYGYDRVWISDDIFPFSKKSGMEVCQEIIRRGVDISWECLCRADLCDRELAAKLKRAGCCRVFLGLESGNDDVLKIMKKRINVEQARKAVDILNSEGVKVGAFFVLGYPGESNNTMLDTIRFASSLQLDYVSFTVPYPIPGTGLYEKLKNRLVADEWRKPKLRVTDHVLLYDSEFSISKLRFGMAKGYCQHYLRRFLGSGYSLFGGPFEFLTDHVFKLIR